MTAARRAAGLVALLACAALLLATAGGGEEAPHRAALELETMASTPNRAAVIVDKGDGSPAKRICIRFDAAAISGEEALRLAAAQDPELAPVLSQFGGMGKAVCALCGIGCPAGDCFCEPDRFWAYHRAARGSASFARSPVGVSTATVADGDVEGYRWGTGAPPALADVRTICGDVPVTAPATTAAPPPPPPTTAPPPAPVPPPPAAPPPAAGPGAAPAPDPDATGPAPAAPAEGGTPPPAAESTTTSAPAAEEATTTTAPEPDEAPDAEAQDAEPDDGEAAAAPLAADGDGGGSLVALAAVGVTFAAMVGGAAALARARRQG